MYIEALEACRESFDGSIGLLSYRNGEDSLELHFGALRKWNKPQKKTRDVPDSMFFFCLSLWTDIFVLC